MKTVEGKRLGNDNIGTPVLEVKKEQKKSPKESPSLFYDSSTICTSCNAEMVDLSKCTTEDLVPADDPPCKKIK